MLVHLVRSAEYDQQEFSEVVDFLTSFEGPVKFHSSEPACELEDVEFSTVPVNEKNFHKQTPMVFPNLYAPVQIPETITVASWSDIFSRPEGYRQRHAIPPEEFVLLLTTRSNPENWFSFLNPQQTGDGYVQTAHWAHYVKCSAVFPIGYLIASLVLQRFMFVDTADLMNTVHLDPVGCMNDFCTDKRQILLKLRTADVCLDCLDKAKGTVHPSVLEQVLRIFEGVRLQILFAQNFRPQVPLSRLVISQQKRIFLPDYGNIEIKLTPLEKTLYLFYLNHPEGVVLHDLVDHREELRALYGRLSNAGQLAQVYNGVEQLVNVLNNSASEKISKIKRKFTQAIGEELAGNYFIQGEVAGRRCIPLQRELVTL